MPRTKTLSDADVVRATAKVLLRVGPARFTLADVAGEAGLSPATLLQRFGSKRGLILAFARNAAAEAGSPFELARARQSSPLAALHEALYLASEGVRTRHEIANNLAVLLDDLSDEELRAAAASHARTTQAAIADLLARAREAGELATTDPKALALSVQAAWNGAIIQWALRGSGPFHVYLNRVLAPLLPPVAQHRTRPARSRSPR